MPNQFSARTAAIIHMALMVSSLVSIAVIWFVRGGIPMSLAPNARDTLSYVAYGLAVALLIVPTIIKRRAPAFERGDDLNAWWAQNGPKFIAIWALGEGACIAGAVLWLLTDNQFALLALSGVGFLTL